MTRRKICAVGGAGGGVLVSCEVSDDANHHLRQRGERAVKHTETTIAAAAQCTANASLVAFVTGAAMVQAEAHLVEGRSRKQSRLSPLADLAAPFTLVGSTEHLSECCTMSVLCH